MLLYPWCDLSTYPAVNPNAIPEGFPYDGRIYGDLETGVFVYVAPDGTQRTLGDDDWDPSGRYRIVAASGKTYTMSINTPGPPWMFVIDELVDGGNSRQAFMPGYVEPRLLYEWTTIVPSYVPSGVSADQIAKLHMGSLGLGGYWVNPEDVPSGAIIEVITRRVSGQEQIYQVPISDGVEPPVDNVYGLSSVTTRVSNLPGGEVFEIVSTYEPTMTWEAACQGSSYIMWPSPSPDDPEEVE